MRPARDLLLPGLILADGAMGTYYAQSGPGDSSACEEANIDRPDLVRQIHLRYLDAGARFLRTNTFASVALAGQDEPDRLRALIRSGYELADDCAGSEVFVAADFGPAYNLEADEYLKAGLLAVETFLSCSADLFMFETFADPAELLPLCKIIKERSPRSVVIASFALSPDGLTRKGISLDQIARTMEQVRDIDIWGLNCGIGPTHLTEQAAKMDLQGKPLVFLPNSGYPRMENQRLVYGSEPEYFARVLSGIAGGRTRLLGGCCGTTPRHIAALNQTLGEVRPIRRTERQKPAAIQTILQPRQPAPLADRLARNAFTVICELDPPRDRHIEPLIAAADELKAAGIHLITLADSPMARVKMDSIITSTRIQRETGLPVLPHLCCRDRNVNALRAGLLALHSEGIRQVLAITGDAIPESDRGFVKPVFNLNSIGLLQLISQMNREQFADEPLLAAAAVDPGIANPDAEFSRTLRKRDAGAALFLTQPVFDENALPLIRRMRREGLKVFIGLMPLVSYRNAQFLSHEVPGIRIPDSILSRFSPEQDKEGAIETGLAITRDLAEMLRPDADGFYLIAPFNRSSLIANLFNSNSSVFRDA
ncbi:MAG: bifunctional homocysteine S-methyltransferase/methylenetetrahydrofolate reductase [Bacillota bacterium]|nr:bifunctional homocysteine S-methyltransferase/methylenetetrahydrofolate reductase [Bacillota bacterium]